MKLKLSILCILMLGAGQAYGAVSGDWQPEHHVSMSDMADHPSQRVGNPDRAERRARNRANRATRMTNRREARNQSRLQRFDDARQRARRNGSDDQRVVVQPTPTVRPEVKSVPEIDGRHAGLALALIMAIFLVTRELRAQ